MPINWILGHKPQHQRDTFCGNALSPVMCGHWLGAEFRKLAPRRLASSF